MSKRQQAEIVVVVPSSIIRPIKINKSGEDKNPEINSVVIYRQVLANKYVKQIGK